MTNKFTFCGFLKKPSTLASKLFLLASFAFFAQAQAQTPSAATCGSVVSVINGNGNWTHTYSAASNGRCSWNFLTYVKLEWYTTGPYGAGWYMMQINVSPAVVMYYSAVQTGILAPNFTVGNWQKKSTDTMTSLTGTGTSNVLATLGTEEVEKSTIKTSLYPNPSTGIVNLKNAQSIDQVQVFSAEGTLLQSEKPNASEAQIDITHLPQGVYLLQITAAGQTSTEKVVKK